MESLIGEVKTMCGRYDLNATAQALAERFGIPIRELSVPLSVPANGGPSTSSNASWQPRYNIAPSQHNPVILGDRKGDNHLELMQWGLVPAWSKEPKVAYSTINARAETVASKPTYRKPLASQRCLVPATGYFEWVETARQGKQPYRIQVRNEATGATNRIEEIFAFAGLYDVWQGPGGEELHSYTIVTTQANDALRAIHSRMPVILPVDLEEAWLDPSNTNAETLVSLLQPYPQDRMIAYPVSRLVNSPMNEGRELIESRYALSATPGQPAA